MENAAQNKVFGKAEDDVWNNTVKRARSEL